MLPFPRGAAWLALFLLCAVLLIKDAQSEGRVVCYYTNWSVYRPGTAKFNPQNINPYLCTHLVYAFGGFTKDNQMKPFDKYQDIEQGGYAKFTGLKTYNKQLKTMIAIGGWNEASSRFSPLVNSPERRQQFIKNILKFLRQNHFDGIDLDWEYPAHREGGKSRDRDNYAQFVQELRAEFEREAEKTGRPRLLLTMAVPAGIEYIDKGYDIPKLNKYLDWFNVLTYDFHSSHEPSVNHHAPLYSLEEESEYNYDAELNIDYSIKYYLKAGADRDKLVLGIPTYGRSYTLINEESTELGAPSEGPGEQGDATREKGYLAYYEICQNLKEDPEWTVVQPNPTAMGPYAYRRNQWVGYDDEAIVRKKAEYVVAHGLGGIMFWAIDNDDFRGTCNGKPYPLIEAAKEAMIESLGLGINEVPRPNAPQKPVRSRSRENNSAASRNRIGSAGNEKSTAQRKENVRRPTTTVTRKPTTPVPNTNFKLTEPEGSSLYIGGRTSTPPPPTTPDPGSDFKCEEEGFFQHPRDCKKYYWCLDSGPSGLGIVAHQFTCPSGLYFNPAADSCDFARNVPCKTKKSTTAPLVSSTTTTTTTARPTVAPNRITAATSRSSFLRTTASTTTTTTTEAPEIDEEVLEYEEDDIVDGHTTHHKSLDKDAEEDPKVIKELIELIRKVGGIEELEKHLLRKEDGSISIKENAASGVATTPSSISKSLYDKVLSRPGTLNSFRNHFTSSSTFRKKEQSKSVEVNQGDEEEVAGAAIDAGARSNVDKSNYFKYSSVLRGNSRQGPQNEGLEKLSEFDGFLKEKKQYVTINRNRGSVRGSGESETQTDEYDEAAELEENDEGARVVSTKRPITAATPSYTSLRRTRPTTTATEVETNAEEDEQVKVIKDERKTYATLSRNRSRLTPLSTTTTEEPEVKDELISSTNRYKYVDRTRPTKSSTLKSNIDENAANVHDEEEEDDGDEDEQNLRTPTANYGATSVSRRPVLSVRRRIINTPTAAALAAATSTSTTTTTTTTSLPTPTPTTLFTDAAAVTQIGELQTTSKYNRIRSRPVITTTTAAAAAAQTTITTTTTLPTTTTILATQSLPTKVIITNNKNHLSSKLKTKFTSINAAEPVTTTTTTSSSSSLATFASDNTISQKQNNAKSPVSVALRRKFHPRRLITTTASSAGATDESATEPPRTQNPLFKRRFSLTYTISATTTSTTPRSRLNEDLALQTSTSLYPEPEDATDQVAKSSIHTSRFNHNAAAAAEEDNEEVSAIKVLPKVQTTLKSKLKTSAASAVGHDDEDADGGIGEAITRRMDNTAGDYGAGTAVTTTTTAPAPAIPSRRASASSSAANKRRPQKANASTSATPNANSSTTRATRQRHRYVRVEPLDRLNQHAASSAKRNGQRGYQTNFDYDYYDEGEQTPRRQVGGSNNNSNGSRKSKKEQQLKVILHGRGIIECLDQGNFPHPLSCRKFISCAKFETGGVVGWEYTCPKGLRYDPASGMCTWANGIDCRD